MIIEIIAISKYQYLLKWSVNTIQAQYVLIFTENIFALKFPNHPEATSIICRNVRPFPFKCRYYKKEILQQKISL